jgi:hypothetical protein
MQTNNFLKDVKEFVDAKDQEVRMLKGDNRRLRKENLRLKAEIVRVHKLVRDFGKQNGWD